MTTTPDAMEAAAHFRRQDATTQAGMLGAILEDIDPTALKLAVQQAPSLAQKAAVEGGGMPFGDVSAADRKTLYLTVIIILAALAGGALVGAAIAIANDAESAAFFTFAGLALGGITGLFIPSPTARN
jgi:hypothetical protein